MNKLLIIFILICMQNINLRANNSFITFYEKIDEATYNENFKQLLSILAGLDSFNAITFGNGLGPQDRNALQLTVLQIIQNKFFDKDGRLKQSNIEGKITNNEENWLKIISTDPKDQNKVLELLQDGRVAVKKLGILKSNYSSHNAEIIEILQQIVANEQYVVIVPKSTQSENKLNNLPNNGKVGYFESVFSCPLRKAASDVLERKCVKAVVDSNSVNIRGINYLAGLYSNTNSPVLKEEIISTILLFKRNSSPIVLLFKENANVFDKELHKVIDFFRNEYKRKHNPRQK